MTRGAAATERLNRFLARRGVSSRRGADGLIAAGRVRVNGAVAGLGATVDTATDDVEVDGSRVALRPPRPVTLALNKPPGVVSTMHDTHGRPTIAELVPALPGLAPIGRLDADSRGLLLLTTDGQLAHRVSHPRHGVRKTYRVALGLALTDAQAATLLAGILLDDGPAHVLELARAGARSATVVMGEGRKRVVRRLFSAVGNEVVDLCRTAVGPVELGDLAEGASRALSRGELDALSRATSPVRARGG